MKSYLIGAAVLSLVFSGCGNSEEPKVSEAAPAEATKPVVAAQAPAAPDAGATEKLVVAQADTGLGKKAYNTICFVCHAQGVAGAPKLGDKAAWAPRIAKGMDTLANNAINGFQGSTGVMPPKGGLPSLSDEEVKAAVAYMVGQSK